MDITQALASERVFFETIPEELEPPLHAPPLILHPHQRLVEVDSAVLESGDTVVWYGKNAHVLPDTSVIWCECLPSIHQVILAGRSDVVICSGALSFNRRQVQRVLLLVDERIHVMDMMG